MTNTATYPPSSGVGLDTLSRPDHEADPGLFICGYCGEPMHEILTYRGGRGYGWTWICPDKCHPDKYANQNIVEVVNG